jgi:predicted DNA binding CopG/RHH family protein
LLEAVKVTAAKAGVPYQCFIRQALENAVQPRKAP